MCTRNVLIAEIDSVSKRCQCVCGLIKVAIAKILSTESLKTPQKFNLLQVPYICCQAELEADFRHLLASGNNRVETLIS